MNNVELLKLKKGWSLTYGSRKRGSNWQLLKVQRA
jgi:hypothetical protein